jgi:hypothetical protein
LGYKRPSIERENIKEGVAATGGKAFIIPTGKDMQDTIIGTLKVGSHDENLRIFLVQNFVPGYGLFYGKKAPPNNQRFC